MPPKPPPAAPPARLVVVVVADAAAAILLLLKLAQETGAGELRETLPLPLRPGPGMPASIGLALGLRRFLELAVRRLDVNKQLANGLPA